MSIPPSLKVMAPSLKINYDTATLDLTDLKALVPSLELEVLDIASPMNGIVKLCVTDLRSVLRLLLSGIAVDDAWYIRQIPNLRQDIENGKFASPTEHYILHGYLEGRLPQRPTVDEIFYLRQYPDVADAVKSGAIRSGFEHFVRHGYAEGRSAAP